MDDTTNNRNDSPSADDVFNSIDMMEEFGYVTIDYNDLLVCPSSQSNMDVGPEANESPLKTSSDPTQLNNDLLSQCSLDITNYDQLKSVINETICQPNELTPLVNHQEFYLNDDAYALSPVIPALHNSQSATSTSNGFTYQMSNNTVGKLRDINILFNLKNNK